MAKKLTKKKDKRGAAANIGRPFRNTKLNPKHGSKPTQVQTKADDKRPLLTGKFIGNAGGFGFITPAGSGADIFIPPHATLGALNGDTVAYKITNEDNTADKPSRTGKIVEIIARAPMVGVFSITNGTHGFVRPSDSKNPHTFSVPPKAISRFGLVSGHVVIFSVDKRTNPAQDIEPCFITEILGHINDPGVDVLTLVRQANVPIEFSEAVMAETNSMPDTITTKELDGRLDLRNQLVFTIDGDDTKDIDDAISFELTPHGNFILGVHIADVTHYVQENSILDESALDRGTSIYLADRVIPMLPHRLSSGICSLFPDVDRLTLSCIMTINPNGSVISYDIAKSVINSKKRWTYNQVQDILDSQLSLPDPAPSTGQDINWCQLFAQMDTLRETLYTKRSSKGALDFNLPETKIRIDETGKPISIEQRIRTRSTGIIEEFMILCNETIASHFLSLDDNYPFVYRTHEAPSAEKMIKLSTLAKNLGITTPKDTSNPIALQRLLDRTSHTAAAQAIATAVLHSLPQAHYTPSDPTHYGLASQAYCHFTSPIRRYADLQVHRITKHWLEQGAPAREFRTNQFPSRKESSSDASVSNRRRQKLRTQLPNMSQDSTHSGLSHFHQILPAVCTQCSQTERIAEALEREVEQLKKVQFMSGKEGQTFEATVSGITARSIYVTLSNTIEGQIPAETLSRKGFTFNKEKNVYSHKSKKTMLLRHGSQLNVKLISVLEDERKLIFHIK